ASFSVGRSFVAPVIPEDRLATLRAAFRQMVADEKFLADARKSRAEVSYVAPEDIRRIVDGVYALPKPVIDRAAKAFVGGGGN
ncbi:MAG: hypothetical protein RL477_2107, partial [Pseudomonadota bacterium]